MLPVGFKKKLRIMKKEYLRPEAFIVPMTTQGMMSMSSANVDDNVSNDQDNWGVKEETTNGGSIWDNEW